MVVEADTRYLLEDMISPFWFYCLHLCEILFIAILWICLDHILLAIHFTSYPIFLLNKADHIVSRFCSMALELNVVCYNNMSFL